MGLNLGFAPLPPCAKLPAMDVATLQNEIQQLPGHLQDRIAAYLTSLRLKREGADLEIQRRLDDSDPCQWESWKEVKADLDISAPDDE
jgi:hypothetical protein